MNKTQEALKLALEALEGFKNPDLSSQDSFEQCELAITAIREALAEQPAQQQCMEHGECFGGECIYPAPQPAQQDQGQSCYCPNCEALSKELAALKAQPQEPDRVKFERHWRKTRGEKKANRELPRHPLQPQTYIQDSANRHWVTWQAAVRSVSPQPAQQQEPVAYVYERVIDGFGLRKDVKFLRPVEVGTDLYTSPPASKPWVGLTDEEIDKTHESQVWDARRSYARAIEAKLREKNA